MRQYETMVIIDAMISDDAINAEVENIGAMITNGGGEILRRDDWGKRKLAYSIKKRQHGYYVIFYYKAEASVVASMEAALKLNDNALRWMTLADYPMSEIVYDQNLAQTTEDIVPVDAEDGEAE
ncbi:30S ribosomal protein S6 [uncultured Fibrobacter sp.]|uniref:30S ribosomal protein S6 n=1 Tax=uncultured Fibrobacter sp. TaxID=261512 RepID=UPI00261ABB3A|nr:30S ribosomal protein S6 [uncultured Fibrobacter sp.]